LRLIVGLAVLGLGVVALFASFGIGGELIGLAHLHPVAGVLMFIGALAVGGTVVFSGVGLVAGWEPKGRVGWLVERLTARHSTVYRHGPWPEDLMPVIGSERQSHSEAQVQEALRQIREVHEERLKATRHSMRLLAGLGAYAGLCGTGAVVLLLLLWLSGEPGPYLHYPALSDSAPQWITAMWNAVAQISLVAFALPFPFLLVGCGALVLCKDWGRKILVWVFGVWMAIASVLMAAGLAVVPFWGPDKLTFLGHVASSAVGLLFYWVLARSVRSATLREVCKGYD